MIRLFGLRRSSLMETIAPKRQVVRKGFFARLRCAHPKESRTVYTRIDHRAGPGSFADNYFGTACRLCGQVLEERRVG
jgi:hypothetical protein